MREGLKKKPPKVWTLSILAVLSSSIGDPCRDNHQEPVDNRQEPVDNSQEPVDNHQEPVDNRQEPVRSSIEIMTLADFG